MLVTYLIIFLMYCDCDCYVTLLHGAVGGPQRAIVAFPGHSLLSFRIFELHLSLANRVYTDC